jgi:7 transmembrane receptor (rhodopsin family)
MMYRSKIRVLKMVAVVVAVFTFFWLPLYAITVRVKFNTAQSENEFYVMHHFLIPPAQWLALSSSSMNPIIYWLFSAKFRTGYRELLVSLCCCCCDKPAERGSLLSQASDRTTMLSMKESNRSATTRPCRSSTLNGTSRSAAASKTSAVDNCSWVERPMTAGVRRQHSMENLRKVVELEAVSEC